MGWWTQNAKGESFQRVPLGQPDMMWGDGPADVLDAALAAILQEFQKALGRMPSKGEIRAGLEFSLRGLSAPEQQRGFAATVHEADEDGNCQITITRDGDHIGTHTVRMDMAQQWAAQEIECLRREGP